MGRELITSDLISKGLSQGCPPRVIAAHFQLWIQKDKIVSGRLFHSLQNPAPVFEWGGWKGGICQGFFKSVSLNRFPPDWFGICLQHLLSVLTVQMLQSLVPQTHFLLEYPRIITRPTLQTPNRGNFKAVQCQFNSATSSIQTTPVYLPL